MPIFRLNSVIIVGTLLSISSIHCMERKNLYPTLHHNRAESQSLTTEQALLLTHDCRAKDAVTFHTNPPSYQELYISKEESEAECKRLTELLALKERELERLPRSLSHNLSVLARKRKVESCNSNIVVSSLAGAYYLITTFVYAGANNYPPAENKVSVMVYCLQGLGSAFGSGFYAVLNAGEKEN